ncbi:MAG: hypothetical protein ACHQ1H_04700 [Nitrososphaerales archaeon]
MSTLDESSCDKCEGEVQQGSCSTCLYSEEDSITSDEAREFTSPG